MLASMMLSISWKEMIVMYTLVYEMCTTYCAVGSSHVVAFLCNPFDGATLCKQQLLCEHKVTSSITIYDQVLYIKQTCNNLLNKLYSFHQFLYMALALMDMALVTRYIVNICQRQGDVVEGILAVVH